MNRQDIRNAILDAIDMLTEGQTTHTPDLTDITDAMHDMGWTLRPLDIVTDIRSLLYNERIVMHGARTIEKAGFARAR